MVIAETASGGVRYRISRRELKQYSINDFKHGDVIECGKYFIWVYYRRGDLQYDSARLLSRVSSTDSMVDLPLSRCPQYILDFLSR